MKKQVIIGLLGAISILLLTDCSYYDNSSVSGVVPVAFELETIAGQDYNIQVCKDEYYQRVVDILDNTFSETSKAYFTGEGWQVKIVDEPLGTEENLLISGTCDYNNKLITVYSLNLEASLEHKLGHYYDYIYDTYIKDDSDYEQELYEEEKNNVSIDSASRTEYVKSSADEFFAECFRGSISCPKSIEFCSQIKESVDNFNAVVDFYNIEEVTDTLKGINKSSDFLATSEVDINKLIDLCEAMSDELRGSIANNYYVILTTKQISTENPHYIIIDSRLPLNKQIEEIRNSVYVKEY